MSCTTTLRAGIEGGGRFTTATFHSTDPDHFNSLMPGGGARLISSPRDSFQASLTRVSLGAVHLQRGATNIPALVRLAPSQVHAGFAFITPTSAPSIRETMLVTHRDISVFGTEQPVSTRWLGANEWFTIAVPIVNFVAAGRALLGKDVTPGRLFSVVQPRAADLHRLRGLHEAITRLAVTEPEALAGGDGVHGLEQQLVEALFAATSDSSPLVMDGCSGHAAILAQFQDFLEAHSDRALYMNEICAELGVAGRTLRFVCAKYLNVSPQQYLQSRRMHLARHMLIEADARLTTVTQVATQFGFWELGRFAVNYRLMFGESPAATLRAPPERHCGISSVFPYPLAKSA